MRYANTRRGVLYFLIIFIFLSIFLFQENAYSGNNQPTISLEDDPRMVAVNPVTNSAVVTHQHSNSVSIVDLNTERIITELRVGKLPKGAAIDTITNTAAITNQIDRSVTLIDLNTNSVTATVDIGSIPNNIAVNSQTHIAAVTSVIDQHMFFIDLSTQNVVAKTHVGIAAGDLAIDPVSNTALVLNKLNKTVIIIDMNNYTVIDSIHLDKRPQAIDVNPETNTALVTNYLNHSVTVIDLLTKRSFIIPVTRYPLDATFNTIDNRAVVLCDRDKRLLLLDLNTNKIIATYSLQRHPKSVAVNSIRNTAIVADDETDGLTIISLPLSPTLPKVKITSPLDNAQIFSKAVDVSGTVERSTNVTVNGISAAVSGNVFSAELILSAGQNTIAAIATDKYGRTACHNILVDIVTGEVTGTVTNAITGWLLPFAIVSINDSKGNAQTITTIVSGTFNAEIAAGAYTGSVVKPWYLPYSFSGSVTIGGTSTINIPLIPVPPLINNITVTDITENSVKINWATDQLSEGSVEHGKTTAYGTMVSDSIEETTHSITLATLSPATTYHFRITATSANGTSVVSNDVTFKTKGHIDIIINSPAAGASINGNSVIVTGSIANAANVETGVTVNGIAASLINNQFAVNNVSLAEGQNTITVTATDTNGTTATKSIAVNAVVNASNHIKLSAYPESGLAPLEITLRVNGTFSISNPVITSTGPGAVERLVSNNLDEFKYKMTTEGVYYFTAQATGPDSNTYSDTIAITALPLAQIDTLLRAKWVSLTDALQQGDTASALSFMSPPRRDNYEIVFNLLKDQWPSIIATYSGLTVMNIEGSIAKYELSAMKNGKTYVYEIDFIKDSSGLWLIEEF
jgi:YVTN family beta-propeller protein